MCEYILYTLKPQYCFGRSEQLFHQSLKKYSVVTSNIRKKYQTYLKLFWMTLWFQNGQRGDITMYITYGKMSGGGGGEHDILRFLVISRKWGRFRACNLQGINIAYTCSSIEKNAWRGNIILFNFFTIYQNYTGALMSLKIGFRYVN